MQRWCLRNYCLLNDFDSVRSSLTAALGDPHSLDMKTIYRESSNASSLSPPSCGGSLPAPMPTTTSDLLRLSHLPACSLYQLAPYIRRWAASSKTPKIIQSHTMIRHTAGRWRSHYSLWYQEKGKYLVNVLSRAFPVSFDSSYTVYPG